MRGTKAWSPRALCSAAGLGKLGSIAMALVSTIRRYQGRIISLDLDTVRFPDGSTGELEMVRHPGAAAVVPLVDPVTAADPRVVLIRQFRHAAEGEVWEIPAGRLDPGETPEACAHRELAEETGLRAREMVRLITVFTTPGFTDERIHLFLASGLTEGDHRREPDEFLESHSLPWSRAMAMIRAGEIVDGKTLVALLYVRSFMRPD